MVYIIKKWQDVHNIRANNNSKIQKKNIANTVYMVAPKFGYWLSSKWPSMQIMQIGKLLANQVSQTCASLFWRQCKVSSTIPPFSLQKWRPPGVIGVYFPLFTLFWDKCIVLTLEKLNRLYPLTFFLSAS